MGSPRQVNFPLIEIPVRKGAVGHIRWAVRPSGMGEVAEATQIQLTADRTGELFRFVSGESVVVTDYAFTGTTPPATSGVLRRDAQGQHSWMCHAAAAEAHRRIEAGEGRDLCREVELSYQDGFHFRSEQHSPDGVVTRAGLRPPQIGALHAIAAHWSLFHQPATIVMPTGTGKTETMLAALVSLVRGRLLVVVPWRPLRDQTVRKFLSLGLLRELGVVGPGVCNPIVGVVTHRPLQATDWDFLDSCNVIVATISSVAQGTAADFLGDLAAKCTHLMIDEAHHLAADSWGGLRDAFAGKPVLQFTATPFRRDGRPVDGKVIYNYPLHMAQRDGYFKRINFCPVFQIDPDEGDREIAKRAVEQLKADLANGYDHIIMARCDTKERAGKVFALYQEVGAAHAPVLVHTDAPEVNASIEALQARRSRLAVCVDMLGEGFDLPHLKVAAVHDTHKSLAVLLQFVGRFTRTSGGSLGEASVIANIANQNVSTALERLYSEDADWNQLLSEFSSEAVHDHVALAEFLRKCERMGETEENEDAHLISPKALFPRLSAVAFRCTWFQPDKFHEGLERGAVVERAWVNRTSRVLFFITRSEPRVAWSTAKALRERVWDLYVLYYCAAEKLLFVHSTNRDTLHEDLAKTLTKDTAELVSGDTVFRCLGGITRLMFQNIGLKRHGRRNIRFSMHTGSDVSAALTPAQTAVSTKSNLFGGGFRDGHPVKIGCSYKGRVWSWNHGSIQEFVNWCDAVAVKLNDATIRTDQIIESVLVPRQVTELPNRSVLCLDWPREIYERPEDKVVLNSRFGDVPLSEYGIELVSYTVSLNEFRLRVVHESHESTYVLRVGGTSGFSVSHALGEPFSIRCGRSVFPLERWLGENPPSVLYVDGTELDGCDLIEPTVKATYSFPPHTVEVWDWADVDLTKESMWKDDLFHTDSVQHRALVEQQALGFAVIFNDDSKGEVADLVCIREDADTILLKLLHCKFSGEADPGKRVKDVVEVSSQAIRSSRWMWRFQDLCRRLARRENTLKRPGYPTRFHAGDEKTLNAIARASRFKAVRTEIVVVQPGVSRATITEDQAMVLNAAHTYLMETVSVPLTVVCSS